MNCTRICQSWAVIAGVDLRQTAWLSKTNSTLAVVNRLTHPVKIRLSQSRGQKLIRRPLLPFSQLHLASNNVDQILPDMPTSSQSDVV